MPELAPTVRSVMVGIALITSGVAGVLFGLASIAVLRILRKVSQPEKMTITTPNAFSWPEGHAEISARVQALGFHELGTVVVDPTILGKPSFMAVYGSEDAYTGSKVSYGEDGQVWILFQTYFQNNALLLTRFPASRHIEEKNLRVHHVSDSVEAAYEHHVRQLADWQQKHGVPQAIHTLEDILRQHEVYNKKYHLRERRWVRRILQMILVRNFLIVFACLMAIVAALDESAWFAAACMWLSVPLIIGMWIRISRRQQAEKSVPGLPPKAASMEQSSPTQGVDDPQQ